MTTESNTIPERLSENGYDEFVRVDPNVLVVDGNVRDDVGDLSGLVASIKVSGVLMPLVVSRDTDGNYVVINGKRRTLAAREAGATTVPCVVRDDLQGLTAIMAGLVENERRKDLNDAERMAAYSQLALGGMSVKAIAEQTGTRQTEVRTAVKVAADETAAAIVRDHPGVALFDAAALVEFADDDKVVAKLTDYLLHHPYSFEHEVERQRDERRDRKAHAAAERKVRKDGLTLLADEERDRFVRLHSLKDSEGEELTDDGHRDCPGHRVQIGPYNHKLLTGCIDPEANGHKPLWGDTFTLPGGRSHTKGPDGKLTEKARKERAEVIANNKAMRAATVVRHRFITDLLKRKALPADALRFAVGHVARIGRVDVDPEAFTRFYGSKRSDKLGGGYHQNQIKAVADATNPRLAAVLLAMVACTREKVIAPDAWRTRNYDTAVWLTQLEAWGYHLAEVEKLTVEKGAVAHDYLADDDDDPVDDDSVEDDPVEDYDLGDTAELADALAEQDAADLDDDTGDDE